LRNQELGIKECEETIDTMILRIKEVLNRKSFTIPYNNQTLQTLESKKYLRFIGSRLQFLSRFNVNLIYSLKYFSCVRNVLLQWNTE